MPRTKRDESPEEASARRLTEARSAVPELPEADLTGFLPPANAVGKLRLVRSWGHALLVQDARGARFKLYRQPAAPVEEPKLKRGRKAAEVPPPGEEPIATEE
jgi:hypothetical protein